MNAIAILFAFGVILLAFEVILPGGIIGVIGGLALLGGCIIAFVKYGTNGGLGATGIALALTALTLYIEFGLLPKTKYGQRLFLKSAIKGTAQAIAPEASALIGQTATTLTPLTPSGYIQCNGQRLEAFSRSGSIATNQSVRIVATDNFRIIVSQT